MNIFTSSHLLDSGRVGLGLAVLSYSFWAMYPFYWVLVLSFGFAEVFAHRMIWSLIFVLILLPIFDGFTPLITAIRNPKVFGLLLLGAIVIGLNWFLYIYAVSIQRIIEASLGYFMSPMFATFSALIFLRERLHKLQYAAVTVVILGILIALVNFGEIPLLGLGMAITFALYSTIRRHIRLPATTALSIELVPPSILSVLYLTHLESPVTATFGAQDWLLLMSAGPVTVIPLLLYGLAVNRAPLVPVALLFYIVPTALLFISIAIFQEDVEITDMIVFACAWTGLGLYGLQAFLDSRTQIT